MASGLYTIRSRITAATEFSATNPIVSFIEFEALNSLPPSYTARIVTYGYNSQGAAHTVLLTLRPPANVAPNADDQIVLESQSAVNSFTSACGPSGIVVPRQYGISSTNLQPPTTLLATAETYRVFFSTTGKANAGTFFLSYRIADGGEL